MPPAWIRKVFVGYSLSMVLLFLVPVPGASIPDSHGLDKLIHFLAFLGFVLLAHLGRPWQLGSTCIRAVLFAAVIELLQWPLPYRDGDVSDFIAGSAGALVGLVLALLWGERWTGWLRQRSRAAPHG